MRVVFVDQASDVTGGAQESLALLLSHLPGDIDPHVILFGEGEYAKRLRAMGLNVQCMGASAVLAGATREAVSFESALTSQRLTARIWSAMRQLKPAVVHTNSVKAHVLGGAAARLAGVPTVTHLRDILFGRARFLIKSMSRFSSSERIAISNMVAINYGLPKTSVVENPIDLSAYRSLNPSRDARSALGLPSDGRLIVLVGRINRWKGQDKFLRAAAAIPRESGAHFIIAGAPRFRDADFLPELRAMAETPDLRGRVTFLDWMDDPRDIFAAADLNVNCSTQEPFGRTVIEAAAAGVPTVCFDDAGVAEFMVEENIGTVVPAGDEGGLHAALFRQIGMDEASLQRERDAARRWANRFDATRHAIRVAAILERASRRR